MGDIAGCSIFRSRPYIIRGEYNGKKELLQDAGVSRTGITFLEEISAAKNRLAKKYHPDANMKNGIDTTRKMQQILEAYRILSDPKKRASYDRKVFGKPSAGADRNFDLFNLHNMGRNSAGHRYTICELLAGS